MSIPTEPIGSIPRPQELIDAALAHVSGDLPSDELARIQEVALLDTIRRFEETGSPVITDGEQAKPSFVGYPIDGLETLAPDGMVIPFADGHTRRLPRLTAGPFRYVTHSATYVERARRHTNRPVKQAVISASALSLVYPLEGIEGYDHDQFVEDLVSEAEADIRGALAAGAHSVQIDFTEGRLSLKLNPAKKILRAFVDLNNRVLSRFSAEDRARIGVHTCPGGDQDSTHSADVDYAELLPELFRLEAGSFYVQLASEPDRQRVLSIIREVARPGQRVFVGVIDPLDPRVESPEDVADRVLEAADILPPERLGTCDDCGFSPFGDDTSTSRETAFAKIRSRVLGTEIAAKKLGL